MKSFISSGIKMGPFILVDGVKVSVNDFIIKAVAVALQVRIVRLFYLIEGRVTLVANVYVKVTFYRCLTYLVRCH